MDILNSNYYRWCKIFLSLSGQWPTQKLKITIIKQTFILLVILTIIFPQLAKLYEIRHDIHSFILGMPTLWVYIYFIYKNVFSVLRRKEFRILLKRVKCDFRDKEFAVLHEYSRMAKKINTYYIVIIFVAVTVYSAFPFALRILDDIHPINEKRLSQAPRPIKYFIKKFDDNIYFILIHGYIVDIVVISFHLGFDIFYVSLIYHTCSLFVIVRFLQILNSNFSVYNLLSIGTCMVPLIIASFEVISNKSNLDEMLRFTFFFIAEVFHLYYINWLGQKIIDHSLLIYQTCYDSNWYEKDISCKYKKLLILIMLRSQKPSSLTAGAIYRLDLKNFFAILRASTSYITVLSSVL